MEPLRIKLVFSQHTFYENDFNMIFNIFLRNFLQESPFNKDLNGSNFSKLPFETKVNEQFLGSRFHLWEKRPDDFCITEESSEVSRNGSLSSMRTN